MPVTEESLELIDTARSILIEREIRLINSRKMAIENSRNPGRNGAMYNQSATANISAATPPQATATASYDPFRRGDTKRNSLKTSISNIFKKPTGSGNSGSGKVKSVHYAFQKKIVAFFGIFFSLLTPLNHSKRFCFFWSAAAFTSFLV